MKFILQLLAFFAFLNVAWLLTYSDNQVYVFMGFALMAVLTMYSIYLIVKIVNNYDEWNKSDKLIEQKEKE